MAKDYSVGLRNAMANAYETYIGTGPIMKLRSGAKPANAAAADSGTVLATIALPADWMGDAVAGVKALIGLWRDTGADAAGTVGHYRLYKSDGVTCDEQGTVTLTGGGGDMTMDNTTLTAGQQVDVTSFNMSVG